MQKILIDNGDRIVRRLMEEPEKIAKVLGFVAFKSLSKKVIRTLACRRVTANNIKGLKPKIISNSVTTTASAGLGGVAASGGVVTASGAAAAWAAVAAAGIAIGILGSIVSTFFSNGDVNNNEELRK